MRRRRDRDGDGSAIDINYRNPHCTDADAVLGEIESQMLAPRGVNLSYQPGAIRYRMIGMFAETSVDQKLRILLAEASEDCLAVRGAMQRKAFSDSREGDQPLPARDLI